MLKVIVTVIVTATAMHFYYDRSEVEVTLDDAIDAVRDAPPQFLETVCAEIR